MSQIGYFEWQMIRALVVLIMVSCAMCAVFQLPLWTYFIGPALAIGVAVWMRCTPTSPTFKAIENQDWKTLLEICEPAIEKNPKDANAYANSALALANLSRFEEALEKIDIAIRLNADLKYCYVIRGIANCGLHNYSEVVGDCTKSIELGHKDPAPHLLRALALTNEYKYDEALKDIELIRQSFPQLKVANLHKAFTLHAIYKTEEAKKLCDEVFDSLSREELPFGLTVRSFINVRLGKIELAIADMKHLIELEPRKQECYLNLALFYAHLGDIQESQANLDKVAPETNLEAANMSAHQARLWLLRKDEKEALKYAQQALEKRPSQVDIRAIYGLALIRNDRHEEAQRELDLAVKADPYCADAYWFRGELYEKLGDEEKAKQDRKVANDYGYIPYL